MTIRNMAYGHRAPDPELRKYILAVHFQSPTAVGRMPVCSHWGRVSTDILKVDCGHCLRTREAGAAMRLATLVECRCGMKHTITGWDNLPYLGPGNSREPEEIEALGLARMVLRDQERRECRCGREVRANAALLDTLRTRLGIAARREVARRAA